MKHTPGLNPWGALVLLALAGACRSSAPADDEVSWLFVQTASHGSFDGTTLTLQQVPAALMFSDRPERITGHMQTSHLLQVWDEGDDAFASDPPNAVLSTFGEHEHPTLATVVLTRPELQGSTLSYTVEVLDGEIPARFGEASLFIDNWGRRDWERLGIGAALGAASAGGRSRSGGSTNPPVAHSDSSYLTYYTHEGAAANRVAGKRTSGQPGAAAHPSKDQELQAQLEKLKQQRDEGLITADEYAKRRQAILKKM